MRKKKLILLRVQVLFFCILVAGVLAIQVHTACAIAFFSDYTAFDTVTDTALVEDFTAFTPKNTSLGDSFTTGSGLTFRRVTGTVDTQKLLVVDNNNLFGPGNVSNVVTDNHSDDYYIDFSAPSTAVGFDTYLNAVDESNTPATPEALIEVYGVGLNMLGTYTHTHNASTVGFLGITADEAIASIRWMTTGGKHVNTGVGNVLQGSTVPEPTAMLLLGTGLIGLAGVRRKI